MKIYYLLLVVVFCSCSPLISKKIYDSSAKPLSDTASVQVITIEQPAPDSCRLIGRLHYGESVFSPSLSYNKTIQLAQQQARAMGGNLLKITWVEVPVEGVTYSYRIFFDVLYRKNLGDLTERIKAAEDSIYKSKFPEDNPQYAILYVYRPSGVGALIGYNINMNDSVICRAKDNSYFKIKLHRQGTTQFTAHTESTSTAVVDMKYGQEYYLQCHMVMGVLIGEPRIQFVPNWQGSIEYGEMQNRDK